MKLATKLALILGAAVTQSASANLLLNGDFENPTSAANESHLVDNWTLTESSTPAGADTGSFTDFANHTTGGKRGFWFRSFMGSPTAPVGAELTQDVAGAAGTAFTLSGFFFFEANYSGLTAGSGTKTLLALDFLNGTTVVNTQMVDIDTIYDATHTGTWQQFSIIGTGGAGTTSVRSRISFVNGIVAVNNPQSAFVDDLNLTSQAVPEPGTLAILGLSVGALMLRRRK